MRSYLTTFGSLAAVGVLLGAISSCGSDTAKTRGPSAGATDPDLAAAKASLASTPLGRVVSRDVRGAGRFVLASPAAQAARLNLGHETVARLHFERHATALGLSSAAVRGAVFTGWHSLPAGAGLAQFEQRIGDVEVFRARASVVVDSANQLVSIANTFPSASIKAWNKKTSFKLSAEDALASAYTAHAGVPLGAGSVRDEGQINGSSARNYAVNAPPGALQVSVATAKRVYFPTGDRLEPAFYVEILGRAAGSHEDDARAYVIAADDARVLLQESLTAHDVFNYRVFAEATGNHVPTDGPIVDVTPHPTGIPDLKPQTFIQPIMVAMEGFNKNPNGAPDPWLDPAATITWGNNVRAYSDRNQGTTEAGAATNDGYQDAGPDGGGGDYRAETTAPKTFDRIYDLTKAPDSSPDQIKAAITQIFYVNNWLHDFWYDSGFDEKSKNAQLSNYNRGGTEGDPLKAEAQDSADSGQSNNANMSSMSDGTSPRMQMYVWTGLPNRKIEVPGVTFNDSLGASGFGPQTFDLGPTSAVLSDDMNTAPIPPTTGGSNTDACQKPVNVTGKIAIVDRGGCNFTVKVDMAQQGGAVGMILVNNAPGHAAPSPGGAFPAATIPLIGISLEDGATLKAALSATTTAHLTRGVEIMRDGTIDNTVVAHEWGHYWHHRLVQCGSSSCGGMSEGWGDFDALMMVIRAEDTFDGKTYALAQYAAQGIARDGSYFGIRRAPYSREMTKNPFTFGHVRQTAMLPTGVDLNPAGADMSEVHNVGEIWAETLFEAYANLIDTLKAATPPLSFDEIKRRMADYLVAGMKATPNEPTFVEQRDAILSTIYATKRMDDFSAIARGFAKRGLGVAAVAPPTTSMTLNEAVEDFSYKGALAFGEATIDDSVTNCDKDGILDAGETGKLTVKVKNTGWVPLTKTQIKATSTDPNVTFGMAGTDMTTIQPYETATVSINVSLKASMAKKTTIPIVITMTDADAAVGSVDATFSATVNYDETKQTSKTDDAESTLPPVWEFTNVPDSPTKAWSREGDAMNHMWHGDALASTGEEDMVSPSLNVSATDPFTIAFKHQYTFEIATIPGAGMAYADGAVLEISEDNGTTWKDVSTYVDPMYSQTIYAANDGTDTNPLAGRKAWAGKSTGYPALLDVKLDLGTKLAGKTVKVRFRIGTDEGTSAAGWDVDDITFGGITNSPFPKVGDNAGNCSGDGGTPSDAGARDGGGGAGGTGGTSGTGGSTPPADDSCNCTLPGGRPTNGMGAAAGVLGAIAMLLRRRRRQQS